MSACGRDWTIARFGGCDLAGAVGEGFGGGLVNGPTLTTLTRQSLASFTDTDLCYEVMNLLYSATVQSADNGMCSTLGVNQKQSSCAEITTPGPMTSWI